MMKFFVFLTAINTLVFSVFILPMIDKAMGKTVWKLNCTEERRQCQMVTHLRGQNQKIISSFTLKNMKSSKNRLVTVGLLQLPLGLHIPSGVFLKIDKQQKIDTKLIDCLPKGCRAIFTITPQLLTLLKSGDFAHIIIKDSKSQKGLSLNYSLLGFSQTWDDMVKVNIYKNG